MFSIGRDKLLEKITSVQNAKIKNLVKLVSSSKERKKTGEFVLEGVRLCSDAERTGVEIKELYFTQNCRLKYENEINSLIEYADSSFEISDEVAKKIQDTENTQGVFVKCAFTQNETVFDKFDKNGKYVVLENLQDPSNLGAIVRTAEALGIDGAVMVSCCDVFNPKAQRASMGSLLRLPFVRVQGIEEVITYAKLNNIKTVATVVDSDAEKINKTDFSGGIMLIIGNEGNGISNEAKLKADKKVTIPMLGRAESLNASMAACIAMWEVLR